MPTPESPLPPPVYLPRSYQWKRPAKLPQPAAPAAEPPQPAAPAAEPTQPAAAPRTSTPPPSRPTTRSSANHNLAPRSEPRSPATPAHSRAHPLRWLGRILTHYNTEPALVAWKTPTAFPASTLKTSTTARGPTSSTYSSWSTYSLR